MGRLKRVLKKSPHRGLVVRTFKLIGSGAKGLWIRRNMRMLSKFIVVSSGTALLNLGVATALIELWGVHYKIAMTVGFVVQVSIESALNRAWTFKAENLPYWFILLLTAIIELGCFYLAFRITEFGVEHLGFGFLPVRVFSMLFTGGVSMAGAWLLTFRRSKKGRR